MAEIGAVFLAGALVFRPGRVNDSSDLQSSAKQKYNDMLKKLQDTNVHHVLDMITVRVVVINF